MQWPTVGFAGLLSENEIASVRSAGQVRRYAKGTAIFREGDRSDWIAFLLRGRVKISSVTAGGRETVLAFREAGDLIGELAAFDRTPRSATVTAADAVEAVVITGSRFRELLTERPRLALLLLELVTHRLRDADRKRVEFSAYEAVGRVTRRLVEMADAHDSEFVELSQDELAGWTGASRESVARALATLRSRGLIRTERRRIVIVDREGLRTFAV